MSRITTLHMLRSAISDSLRSRGFIISWLNPTPHAIAVYASQPLSPVTTIPALPGGKTELLWPKPLDLRLERGFDRPVRGLDRGHARPGIGNRASLSDTLDLRTLL